MAYDLQVDTDSETERLPDFARRTRGKLLDTPFSEAQREIRARDLIHGTELFRRSHPAAYEAVTVLVKEVLEGRINSCNELTGAAEAAAATLSPADGAFVEEAVSDSIRHFLSHSARLGLIPETIERAM